MIVVPGIAVCGVLNPATQQVTSGFAFNQQPATFTGKWQHMIYGSSQGSVTVTLTRWDSGSNSRVVVATANQTLSGMAMSWTNFSIPFTYTDTQAPDTCIIVMRASGSLPTNNDYLWVDNLAFSGNVAELTENTLLSSLVVYPNPALNDLNIAIDAKEAQSLNFEIFGLNGVVLNKGQVDVTNGNTVLSIDISALHSGSYFIRFGNEKQHAVVAFKVVK